MFVQPDLDPSYAVPSRQEEETMLNFDPVSKNEITIDQLCATLTLADLRQLTDEMIDAMLTLIAGCTDADVTFVPDDPEAEDTFATDPDEANLAWTLGHVIVHATASSEEAAFLAAELARGVPSARADPVMKSPGAR